MRRHRRDLSRIRIVACDVDGVLTDGGMYYSSKGEQMKKFNARDGKAIERLRAAGYAVALITGEDSDIVRARAKKLKISDVYCGAADKVTAARHLLGKYGYEFRELLYCGDDHNDGALMVKAGFSCCPADATTPAVKAASLVCGRNGGAGVLSEIADILLEGKV